MRPLLIGLFAGALAAAEAIPAIELTWDGTTRPALSEPLAGWWDAALGEGATWWAAQGAPAVEARAAVAGCRGLHLIGVGVPGGASGPLPWVAGWWQDAPETVITGVRQVVADWPGYNVAVADGRLSLAAPGVVAAPTGAVPEGWRVVIHGDAIAASLDVFDGVIDDDLAPFLEPVRKHLLDWRVSAGVDASGHGWIDTGLPARWLAAPEIDVAGRLPRDAIASAVIALDGAAIAADLAAALDPVPAKLTAALALAQTDLRAIGAALSGTWAIAVTGEGQGIACIPRSATLDRVALLWIASEGGTLPAEGATIAVDDGLYLACAPRWWLLSDKPERIAAFLAQPTVAAPDRGALAWADAHAAPAAGLLAHLPDDVLAQWPLPRALIGSGDKAEMIAKDFGWKVEPGRWRDSVSALANAGDHRLDVISVDGHIRVDLGGPLLPWVIPGLAVRWFADHAQDLCGRTALRRHIAARQAAGQGALPSDLVALPSDLVALVPPLPAERIAEAQALVANLPRVPMIQGDQPSKRAKTAAIPLPAPDAAWLAAAKELIEASTALDDPTFPAGSTVAVLVAKADGTLGPMMKSDYVTVARRLAQSGRNLSLFGDGEGVLLADRALRLARDPLSALQLLVTTNTRDLRDDAWLYAGLTHAQPLDRIDAWAAEPPPDESGRPWQGERLIMSVGASGWLEATPPANAGRGMGDVPGMQVWQLLLAPAIWHPHVVRARTATSLVAMDQLLFHWQDRDIPLPAGWRPPDTPVAAMTLPGFWLITQSERRAATRHVLIRLAWRLHRLGQGGALPADATAAALALGPLTVPYAGARLPLSYQRRGAGFILGIDTSGERPDAVDHNTWQRWTKGEPPAAEIHLQVPGQRMEIVIDPRRPDAAAGGDPDSRF